MYNFESLLQRALGTFSVCFPFSLPQPHSTGSSFSLLNNISSLFRFVKMEFQRLLLTVAGFRRNCTVIWLRRRGPLLFLGSNRRAPAAYGAEPQAARPDRLPPRQLEVWRGWKSQNTRPDYFGTSVSTPKLCV